MALKHSVSVEKPVEKLVPASQCVVVLVNLHSLAGLKQSNTF